MKNVLNYQSSEYDCGPTSVVNALRFLYAREELPPCLVKGVWTLCNDTFLQGEHMGRPSLIRSRLYESGGTVTVRIGGSAVMSMSCDIKL